MQKSKKIEIVEIQRKLWSRLLKMGLFMFAVLPLAVAKSKPYHHKQLQKNGGSPKSKDFINKQNDEIRNHQKREPEKKPLSQKNPSEHKGFHSLKDLRTFYPR